MKKLVVLGLTMVALANVARASDNNQEAYFSISNVEFNEVVPSHEELYLSQDLFDSSIRSSVQEPPTNLGDIVGELDGINVVLDRLILIGKKVIDIIKAGEPVVDVNKDVVHVVPQGITAWQQLAGWKTPITKVFVLSLKNRFNATVVTTRLKVSATQGGSYNGKGRYLSNVYVVPSNIHVAWGFKFNVWMESHQPVNTGTAKNPVAGLGVDLHYRVGAVIPLQAVQGSQDYFIRGDGNFQPL